ncbi:hypothetical protein OBBRIDRAFT_814827 [Obba rivulosa]|uniref:Uncharacterized protein n=1 Tax=Obba rivulosa TaxID=1052685 RepID=A0A8E2DHM8_9APHY|nr:hypothetical protein OBBRIDRAFT_814827 [Obba rivulosa]
MPSCNTSQGYWATPTFSTNDIPDLTWRVMIVTGSCSAISLVVVALLQHNAKVYMASRSEKKVEVAIKNLKELTGKEALLLQLNLCNVAAIKRSTQEFRRSAAFSLVLLSVGLRHWYFTALLMQALLSGKESSSDGHTRGITTSKTGTQKLYSQSKFLNVVVSHQVAKHYGDQGVIALSCNPGYLKTDLQRHIAGLECKVVVSALTQLWGGLLPELAQHNGEFVIPWVRMGKCRPETYDDVIGEQLWCYLQEQVKNT